MKKLYLLGILMIAAVLPVSAVISTYPYELVITTSTVGSSANDDGWCQKSYDGASVWSGMSSGVLRLWGNNNPTDDWLISPAFQTKAGSTYTISFEFRLWDKTTFTDNSSLKLYFTSSSPFTEDGATATKALEDTDFCADLDLENADKSNYQAKSFSFVADKSGKMYFAFHMLTPGDNGNLFQGPYFQKIKVEQIKGGPAEFVEHSCEGAKVPFTSETAAGFNALTKGWTQINHNGDNREWHSMYESGYIAGIEATSAADTHDDFLLSPAVHMEAGKEYGVVWNWKTKSSEESLSVYASTVCDEDFTDKIKESAPIYKDEKFNSVVMTKQGAKFTPEKDGEYHIIFYIDSPKGRYNAYVKDVFVDEYIFLPAEVTGFTVIPSTNRKLFCDLAWELPATDTFGMPFEDGSSIEKVRVYRDDSKTPIAELDGTATSFKDTETTGLVSGRHTYSVAVVVNGVEGKKAVSKETGYFGPVAATAVPADFKIDSKDKFDYWTAFKLNSEELSANTYAWEYNSDKYASYQSYYNKEDDDWLIAPPVKVEQPGYYRASFHVIKNNGYPSKFVIGMSSECDPETMTLISEEFDVPQGSTVSTQRPFAATTYDFYVETPGDYYIGLHNKLGANHTSGTSYYYVEGLEVVKSQFVPALVTDLTAVPADDKSNKINISWKNPVKDFAGRPMTADQYKVQIFVNPVGTELSDTTKPTATITDGSTSFVAEVDKSGIYEVVVRTVSAENVTAPQSASVVTTWVGEECVYPGYITTFDKNDVTNDMWTVVDGNPEHLIYDKTKTFTFDSFFKLEVPCDEYKDYLVSPAIVMEPGVYKVSIKHRGGGVDYPFTPILGLVEADGFDAEKGKASMLQYVDTDELTDGTANDIRYSWMFKVDEGGKYQIVYGIEETFSQNVILSYQIQFREFAIQKTEAYPANVTELTAVPDADKANTVDLSWVNPEKYYGIDFELTSIESVTVERDGEVIKTITEGLKPGEKVTYKDNVPEVGRYTYTVYCTINGIGHGNDYATVQTEWVGKGYTAPVSHEGEFPGWTVDDVHGDYDSEYLRYGWYTNSSGVWNFYHNGKGDNDADDYLVTAPVEVEKDNIYKVTFTMAPTRDGDKTEYQLDVHIGNQSDHKEFEKVHSLEIPKTATDYSNYSFYVAVTDAGADAPAKAPAVHADEVAPTKEELYAQAVKVSAGTNRIALHATTVGGARIKAFNYVVAADKDGVVTGIEAVEAGKVVFDGKALCFAGEADVKVFNVAGMCVAAVTARDGFSFEDFASGYYIVKVTAAGEIATFKVAVK